MQMLIVLFKNVSLSFVDVDCFFQKCFFLCFVLMFKSCKHKCCKLLRMIQLMLLYACDVVRKLCSTKSKSLIRIVWRCWKMSWNRSIVFKADLLSVKLTNCAFLLWLYSFKVAASSFERVYSKRMRFQFV